MSNSESVSNKAGESWLKNPVVIVLLLSIGVGLILRVWGISFGLPFTYHLDEGFEVNRALQLANGSFDFDRVAKGGYFYVLFVEFGFLFVFLYLAGLVESTRDFAMWFIRDPSYFYLVGRFTTAVLGTLCIYLTYRMGERCHSRLAGMAAAVLLAINVLHVQHSHYITVDIPLTFLAALSLLYMIYLMEGRSEKNYLWAGFFVALATMTKLPGIILLLPFFMAHMIYTHRLQLTWLQRLFYPKWIAGVVVFVLAYIAGAPGIVVNFRSVISGIFGIYGVDSDAEDSDVTVVDLDMSAVEFDPLSFYVFATLDSMGWLVFGLCLLGLAYAVVSKNAKGIVLAAFSVVFFLALALSSAPDLAYTRYVLPILPPLLVLAGIMLAQALDWSKLSFSRPGSALLVAVACLALSFPNYGGLADVNAKLTEVDTRTLSRQWFEDNVPEGSRVLLEGFSAQVFKGTTPLLNSEENLRNAIEEFKANGEKGKAKYFSLAIEAQEGVRYNLSFFLWQRIKSTKEYAGDGIEYIVIRPEFMRNSVKYTGVGPAFMEDLESTPYYRLIKSFDGDGESQTGPDIKVYQLVNAAEMSHEAGTLNHE